MRASFSPNACQRREENTHRARSPRRYLAQPPSVDDREPEERSEQSARAAREGQDRGEASRRVGSGRVESSGRVARALPVRAKVFSSQVSKLKIILTKHRQTS